MSKIDNENILISFKYKARSSRFLMDIMYDIGSYYLILVFLIVFFGLSKLVGIIFLPLIFFYLFIRYRESSLFITQFSEQENNYIFKYVIDHAERTILVPKSRLSVEWFDTIKGIWTAPRLVFKEDNLPIINQYATGEWNRELIKSLYFKLDSIKYHTSKN